MDDTGSQSAVWASPSWRGQAVAWLDAQLEAAGIRRTADDADEYFLTAPLHCLRSLLDESYVGGA